MSTQTLDRQFLLICVLGAWITLRLIAAMLGLLPWPSWITLAMMTGILALVIWLNNMEDYP